ncbi:toll/interleukin-1 receptor domain-containing protein [Shouchella miscanthi]|uniref:toll/interleukin-1 receptor domain-containing protein n=1 Tax=Shouchella miscanthi TaxID=2598861 RepID=UPI001643ECC1|nr:toll/interleukin-1 receptor domain-containing protein [Shouchella miscanthi]
MKIFFSHASKDESFVTSLIDLIQVTLELKRDEFFYTSGGEIRSGDKWLDRIRVELDKSDLVVAIVTPNFLESSYCHIELGASWIKELKVVPIMVPPTNKDSLADTPFNFSHVQMTILESEESLRTLLRDIRDNLIKLNYKVAFDDRTESVRIKRFFRESLNPFINKNRDIITRSKASLIKENQEQQLSLESLIEENDKLNKENKRIRSMKDFKELEQYDLENSNVWEKFESFAGNIKSSFNSLSFITASVFYEQYIHSGYFSEDGFHTSDLKAAVNRKEIFFIEDYNAYELNKDHPKVEKVHYMLQDFQYFIEENHDALVKHYNAKHGEDNMLDLDLRDFWVKEFSVTVYDSAR